jgi:hypothetical protein
MLLSVSDTDPCAHILSLFYLEAALYAFLRDWNALVFHQRIQLMQQSMAKKKHHL